MSDSNFNRKNNARQENIKLSHYELGRGCLRDGLQKSATRYGEISQRSTPHTARDAAGQIGQSVWAGAKDYGKAAAHYGKGFMQGVSQQHPSPGQQLNNMKINQAIVEGRSKANQIKQNSGYTPKVNQVNQQKTIIKQPNIKTTQSDNNKGIETARQESSEKQLGINANKSSNQGIKSFQSKSSDASRGNSSNASKGNTNSGKSSNGSSSATSHGSSR